MRYSLMKRWKITQSAMTVDRIYTAPINTSPNTQESIICGILFSFNADIDRIWIKMIKIQIEISCLYYQSSFNWLPSRHFYFQYLSICFEGFYSVLCFQMKFILFFRVFEELYLFLLVVSTQENHSHCLVLARLIITSDDLDLYWWIRSIFY